MCHHESGACRTVYRPKSIPRLLGAHPFSLTARAVFAALLIVLAAPLSATAQRGVSASFLEDAKASLSIKEAASSAKTGEYKAYVPSFMAFSRLPDSFNGALWLRMVFSPSFEAPTGASQITFGSSLPGTTRLFIPQPDGSFSVKTSPPPRGVFVLPAEEPFPKEIYARIDGTPGLWFRPSVEPIAGAPHDLPMHLILTGVFAFAMLLLVIQYIRKAEEWRLWAAITAGCGIVAALIPPTPEAGGAYSPLVATGMLMPGLILFFFAHATRHLLASPKNMPGYDRLFILYYLVGGVIALLPLIPGFLWVARYLPLAWLILLPFLPAAMVALARSLKGGGGFFCAALLPIVGVAVSAWELMTTGAPFLGGAGGLWGLAFGMIILGFTASAKKTDERADDDVFASLDRACSAPDPTPVEGQGDDKDFFADAKQADERPADASSPDPASLETPKSEETTPDDEYPDLSLFAETENKTAPKAVIETAPEGQTDAAQALAQIAQNEPSEFPPLPDVFADNVRPIPSLSAAFEADAPRTPPIATPVEETSPSITLTEEEEAFLTADAESSRPAPPYAYPVPGAQDRKSMFDLPLLVKEAYDAVAMLAEQKSLGLTWFIAPQTGRLFEGEANLLESALRLLLRDMVEAVDRGNVRLNVRRLPDSSDVGHLVFTVVEWDARQTAHARNMAGLAEAWALAEKTGGIFSVEHSPTSGATVIFSAVFASLDKSKSTESEDAALFETAESSGESASSAGRNGVAVFKDHPDIAMPADIDTATLAPLPPGLDGDDLAVGEDNERAPFRVVVVDTTASGRARTAQMLTDTPYSVLESASPAAASALYARHPSGMLLMNADMPEMDIVAAIQKARENDAAQGRTPVKVVTFVEHAQQAARMMQAGSDRTLMKPVSSEDLLDALSFLLPAPKPLAVKKVSKRPAAPMRESAVDAKSRPNVETARADAQEQIIKQPETVREATPPPAPTPEAVLHKALAEIPSLEAQKKPAAAETRQDVPESGIFAAILPEAGTSEVGAAKEQPPSAAKRSSSGPELALLDMIVTDDEPQEEKKQPAVRVKVSAPKRQAVPKTSQTASNEAPTADKQPKPAVVQIKKIKKQPEDPSLTANPSQPDGEALILQEGEPLPPPEISIPLPGEEDSVFKDMLPLVPGLIHDLSDAMRDAARGRDEKSPLLVQEAAERVAGKAEAFGLTKLERMARCVERAAAADDIEPMECVLADLESWVGRYKDALQKLHREMPW